MKSAPTVWLTGLPCSGKSTISVLLADLLRKKGKSVEILDGDTQRAHFADEIGFSKKDRDFQVQITAYLAKLLSRNGIVVIVALVSPYRQAREDARKEIPNFIEVYLDCSVNTCAERDVKGMYKKAIAGEILQFTGISDPYEPPLHPEITFNTEKQTPEECADSLLETVLDRS